MGEGNSFSLLVCPHPGGTYPGQVQMGGEVPQGTYPHPGQDGGGVPQGTYPWPGQDGGRGTPKYLPPARLGRGVPQGTYPPPPPRTCYTAGGMPLVFTQEDFLVSSIVSDIDRK